MNGRRKIDKNKLDLAYKYYQEYLQEAISRDYKKGWAYYMVAEKFGFEIAKLVGSRHKDYLSRRTRELKKIQERVAKKSTKDNIKVPEQ